MSLRPSFIRILAVNPCIISQRYHLFYLPFISLYILRRKAKGPRSRDTQRQTKKRAFKKSITIIKKWMHSWWNCGLSMKKMYFSIEIQVQVPVVLCGSGWWCVGAQVDVLIGRIECLAEHSLLHRWRAQLHWVAGCLKICHGRFHTWEKECALAFTLPNWLCCHGMQRDLF